MGTAEWGGNPVCWWLGLYFCFVCCLDAASCTGCLLVVGRCWVLYSTGFLCASSHYLIPPRVSSLVVWGLGVSAPTPMAQGLILSFVWLYIIIFCWPGTPSALSWCSACTSVSKVYSWCICGDRCTPCPPTPLPSCSQPGCLLSFPTLSWKLSSFWRDYRTPISAGLGLLLMNLYKQNPSLSTSRSLPVPFLNCQVLGAVRPLQGKNLRTNGPSSC